jgi:hypothetical protein
MTTTLVWTRGRDSANIRTYTAPGLYAVVIYYSRKGDHAPSVSVRIWQVDDRDRFVGGYGDTYASRSVQVHDLNAVDAPALLAETLDRKDPS